MDLQGKAIVVTGTAQGLGQKMAEILDGQGANLALADLDHAKLQDTIKLRAKAGGKAKDYPVDVADEFAVVAPLSRASDWGCVDGLITKCRPHGRRAAGRAADGKRVVRRRAPKCVLVVPDLEAGNILVKSLSFLARAEAAGIVVGVRVRSS